MNQDIKQEAETLHKEFIEKMYPEFNLNSKPKIIQIEIFPKIYTNDMEVNGRYHPEMQKIEISESSVIAPWFVAVHETGHYLHKCAQPSFFGEDFKTGEEAVNFRILREIIAEKSSCIFF